MTLPPISTVISFDDTIKIGRIVHDQVQVGRVITFGGLLTDSQRILDAAESKEGRFIGINAPRSGAYDNGFQVVHMGYGVMKSAGATKLCMKQACQPCWWRRWRLVNNVYGVSWQHLVDSQRIMDITCRRIYHPSDSVYLHQHSGNRPRWSRRRRRTLCRTFAGR